MLLDIWIALSDADRGILRLFKELVYKPGIVARDYVEGQRRKYLNPFSFLFLMVAIALYFILRFEHVAISQLDPLALSRFDSGENNVRLLQYSFRYFNIFILLMCPINGFLIWLFFRSKGRNYAENTVLAAYLSGQTMFYYCIVLIPFVLFPQVIPILGIIIGLLLSLWYFMGIFQFHQTRSARDIIKAILVILLSQMVSQQLILRSFEFQ